MNESLLNQLKLLTTGKRLTSDGLATHAPQHRSYNAVACQYARVAGQGLRCASVATVDAAFMQSVAARGCLGSTSTICIHISTTRQHTVTYWWIRQAQGPPR